MKLTLNQYYNMRGWNINVSSISTQSNKNTMYGVPKTPHITTRESIGINIAPNSDEPNNTPKTYS